MNSIFILYALSIYIISNGIGKYLIKKDSNLYILRSLLGFCLLLFGLQIIYYPIQWYQLSSGIVFISTGIVILLGLYIGIKNLKREDFFFLRHWEFYLLFILVFWIIKIIPATEAGDDWFYMPMIMDNANIAHINSIQPRSGWNWNIAELWSYQGYYLLVTFLYQLQSFISTGFENIFIVFRSTFSLLMIVYSSIILISLDKMLHFNNKAISFIVKATSIFLVNFLDWSHVYWGSFATLPTLFPLLMILLNEYSKNKESKLAYLIAIVSGAMLSLFSSSLFLNVFLIYAFFAYCGIKKMVSFKDFAIMLFPTMLFLCFFIKLPYLTIIILPCYVWIYRSDFILIDKFLNRISKYIVIALPIVIVILSIILNLNFTWNYYRLSYTFLMFNIVISVLIIYSSYKITTYIEPIYIAFVIFNITFFNPLVCPLIAHFFTTEEVYYRLFYITKNPLILSYLFYFLYKLVDKKEVYKSIYKVALCSLCIYYSFTLLKNVNFEIGYSKEYNYILRESKDSLALGDFLNNSENIRGSYVWSIYFAPRQYDISYKSNVIRYPDSITTNSNMLKMMYSEDDVTQEEYIDFKNQLYRESVDLLITYNNERIKNKLIYLSNIIYQNDTFTLYQVNIK